MQNRYYLHKLKEDFSRRKRINAVYSLRAYGRDLGVHPATLSQVLLGNRPLPLKNASKVMERLNLNGKERTLFSDSIYKSQVALDGIKISNEDDRVILDEANFQVLAEWEHYAVLTSLDCNDFTPTKSEIADRFGLSDLRLEVVINNLITAGLIKQELNGTYSKCQIRVRTTEDVNSHALRAGHRENLDLGKHKLDEVVVELRDFSSLMTAVDVEKIPEAKAIIREFRLKMLELMKSGKNKTEVYQMAIQFYPLTKPKDSKIERRK